MLLPCSYWIFTVKTHGVENGFPEFIYTFFGWNLREHFIRPSLTRNSYNTPANFVGHLHFTIFGEGSSTYFLKIGDTYWINTFKCIRIFSDHVKDSRTFFGEFSHFTCVPSRRLSEYLWRSVFKLLACNACITPVHLN
ncbi:hypothetical protein D3C75_469470 [compost metagenome]